MKIILLSIGSRGDIEPFCALTQELLHRSCSSNPNSTQDKKDVTMQVELFVERNQRSLTDPLLQEFSEACLAIRFFPFENAGFVPKNSPASREDQLDKTTRVYREDIFPAFDIVLDAAKDADVVVSCNLTNFLCILVYRRLLERQQSENAIHIPKFVFLHLQPLAPNTLFPCYRTTSKQKVVTAILDHFFEDKNGEQVNDCFESYWKLDMQVYERLFAKDVSAFSPSIPSMCSWEDYQRIFSGKHPDFMIANVYSKYLVPIVAGTSSLLGENILDIGPLADDYSPFQSTQEQPQAMERINEFCEISEEKPICIGFGSMPFGRRQEIFQALQQLGNPRAILVGKALEPSANVNTDNILHFASIPYPWLFPKISIMICHGGMGVLSSCLRAGIPAVVCPVMGDQFLTGSLVQGLGLGRQAGTSLNTLTAGELVDAVRKVRGNQRVFERCRRVGKRIRGENFTGAERLSSWIVEQENLQ